MRLLPGRFQCVSLQYKHFASVLTSTHLHVLQVSVYLCRGGFSFHPPQLLTGSEVYARYGSAIAALGDLDMDGYNGERGQHTLNVTLCCPTHQVDTHHIYTRVLCSLWYCTDLILVHTVYKDNMQYPPPRGWLGRQQPSLNDETLCHLLQTWPSLLPMEGPNIRAWSTSIMAALGDPTRPLHK